jgi:hypothetical protein
MDIVLANVMDLVDQSERERFRSYADAWSMYLDKHEKFFPRFDGEDDRDYTYRIRYESYSLNFIRRIVDTITTYLYGRDVSRKCLDPTAQKAMNKLWLRTHMKLFMQGVKTIAGVTGTSYVIARYLPTKFPKKDLIPIRYEVVDSIYVTLIFDPAVPTHMKEVIIHYAFDGKSGVAVVDQYKKNLNEPHEYVEWITDDEWLIWVDGKLQNGTDGQPDTMNWEKYEGKNPVGDVNAVFTVYRNYELPVSPYGISDIKDAISVNLKLDQRKSDEGAIIQYHGLPLLAAFGFSIEDLVRGVRRTIEVPGNKDEVDLRYITWDGNVEASHRHCDGLMEYLMALARLPEIAFFAKGAGDLRSAPALEIAFAPAREAVLAQQATFGKAEVQRIQGDLKILTKLHGAKFGTDEVEIVWPTKFLPVDSFIEAETWRVERELGIKSWDDQLKAIHPLWDDEQIAAHKAKCRQDPLFGKGKGGFFGSGNGSGATSAGEKSREQDESQRKNTD